MSVDDNREFIIDCLTDPGNGEKQAALRQWLQESEANRILYAETKQLWDAAEGMPASSFDKEQGWQLLSQQISGTSAHVVELKREIVSSTREEAPASTAPFIRRSWYIAAACLPLFLFASWLIWVMKRSISSLRGSSTA